MAHIGHGRAGKALDGPGQRQVKARPGQIRLRICSHPGQGQNMTRTVTTGRPGAMTGVSRSSRVRIKQWPAQVQGRGREGLGLSQG